MSEPKTYENAAPSGFQDWLKPKPVTFQGIPVPWCDFETGERYYATTDDRRLKIPAKDYQAPNDLHVSN